MTAPQQHPTDDLLNAFIDGDLTATERGDLERHLAACSDCAIRLGHLRAVTAMLADLPMVAPPRSFALTADMAKKPTPIRPADRPAPSTILRLLPTVRVLSVAAMLAVMIMTGALGFGLIDNDDNGAMDNAPVSTQQADQPAPSLGRASETDTDDEASTEDNQGENETASTGTGEMDPTAGESPQAAAADDGLTTVELATIALGVVALFLTASWIWMSYQQRSLHQEHHGDPHA